jgi:hypothetical protein
VVSIRCDEGSLWVWHEAAMRFELRAAARATVGRDIGRQRVGTEVGFAGVDRGCKEAKDRWEDAG